MRLLSLQNPTKFDLSARSTRHVNLFLDSVQLKPSCENSCTKQYHTRYVRAEESGCTFHGMISKRRVTRFIPKFVTSLPLTVPHDDKGMPVTVMSAMVPQKHEIPLQTLFLVIAPSLDAETSR